MHKRAFKPLYFEYGQKFAPGLAKHAMTRRNMGRNNTQFISWWWTGFVFAVLLLPALAFAAGDSPPTGENPEAVAATSAVYRMSRHVGADCLVVVRFTNVESGWESETYRLSDEQVETALDFTPILGEVNNIAVVVENFSRIKATGKGAFEGGFLSYLMQRFIPAAQQAPKRARALFVIISAGIGAGYRAIENEIWGDDDGEFSRELAQAMRGYEVFDYSINDNLIDLREAIVPAAEGDGCEAMTLPTLWMEGDYASKMQLVMTIARDY